MHGAWLSLVERVVRDYEVAGSNPVAPIYHRTSAIMLVSSFARYARKAAAVLARAGICRATVIERQCREMSEVSQ